MAVTWHEFVWFAVPALLCWAGAAAASALKKGYRSAAILAVAGLCVYAAFIALFWIGLQHPPLRTLGETRLWYAFFMMLAGTLTYLKWRYRWMLAFCCIVAAVFILLNIARPEIHDQMLMPALQSYWFVPHVTVYIFSYAVLGCAFLLAVVGLARHTDKYLPTTDRLVYTGVAFLTFGMLSGALWAKQAWGDYWNWDPKETWAAVTWSLYLLYIHIRLSQKNNSSSCSPRNDMPRRSPRYDIPGNRLIPYILLILAFLALQMSWYGVNYLPSAQNSLHVYMN